VITILGAAIVLTLAWENNPSPKFFITPLQSLISVFVRCGLSPAASTSPGWNLSFQEGDDFSHFVLGKGAACSLLKRLLQGFRK
jgi:hypothetical protein